MGGHSKPGENGAQRARGEPRAAEVGEADQAGEGQSVKTLLVLPGVTFFQRCRIAQPSLKTSTKATAAVTDAPRTPQSSSAPPADLAQGHQLCSFAFACSQGICHLAN